MTLAIVPRPGQGQTSPVGVPDVTRASTAQSRRAALADGAAVDSLVYEYLIARDPDLAARTRVIHRSPPFGIPPVVVNPAIRPQLRAELQALLLGMADDPDGQAALRAVGVDRFVTIDYRAYDSARELRALIAAGPASNAP